MYLPAVKCAYAKKSSKLSQMSNQCSEKPAPERCKTLPHADIFDQN